MKINFGKFKRKNIIIGNNSKMRPTQERAKSIIFNTLNINENDKVIDLFSGTGALGFESASLGAETVYWSDNNIESVKAIEKNIDNFELNKNNFKVFKTDFRTFLKKIPFKPTLIFLDPPFIATKYYDEALKFIYENKILAKNGVIVLEKPYKLKINSISVFNIIDSKKLGDKDIIFISL